MLASGGAAIAALLAPSSAPTSIATPTATASVTPTVIASLIGTSGTFSNSFVPLVFGFREEGGLSHHPPWSQID